MKHYGDIQKIDGHKVPLVDIITAGSPCQDLSIAGKRAGLSGERSGLFMEVIRIIKEMHDESRRTNQPVRPRLLVFENVTGVLSSNDGEDFRTILEEVIHIVDPDSDVPRLAEGQSWSGVGCVLGDGWSLAWKVHDSQFWGVPQRRRRLCLVADFRGESASRRGRKEELIMASIYELTDDIRFINQMMEEGEVDPEALKGALEVSKEELKIKLEHYCQFIKNLESDIDGLKMEEQRLSLKRKHLEDTKERMKAAMEWSLGEVGETKLECGTFKVSKQLNPASVKVDCELSLIPEKYLIPQEPKIDKKLLKEDIDGGVDLSGVAHLERTESLRIK